MSELTNEQLRQIIDGAPDGATHYCKRNRLYFKRDGNSDRLYVWLRGTKEWTVPVGKKTQWLDRMANLKEILALRERVAQMTEAGDNLVVNGGNLSIGWHQAKSGWYRAKYQSTPKENTNE